VSLHCWHYPETGKGAPPHLVADEKHCDWIGNRVYLAVTAAQGCILGASLSASVGQDGLTEAYGAFQQEAAHHAPDYAPKTVTTDGWDATRAAWETLFPGIVWILCFLHEVIKIRDWCRSKPGECSDNRA